MNQQISKFIDPIKSFWMNMSKKTRTVVVVVGLAIILISLALVMWLNAPKYTVLYPGMDRDEAIEVMASLDERNVDYKEENGTILVPEEQEDSLRMDLSNEGHPRTAPNYDFFLDNVDIMSTDAQKKIIEKYQLNQRLEAVIKTIDGIKNASVTITIPENDGYVLSSTDKDKMKATAGVTVTMDAGKPTLTSAQVSGIKRLLAKSVPNLPEEDVAVIDTAIGMEILSSDMQEVNLSEFKQTVEAQIEADIVKKVRRIIEPFYGTENVGVTAKGTIDIDKSIQEITTYQPSEENRGVISEESRNSEGEKNGEAAGGIPGTNSNTQTPTYPGVTADENTLYIKNNDSYKYLVSQVKEQVQKEPGQLKDLTVSVIINRNDLTDVKKEELRQLVANTAAIAADKVIVYNDSFAVKPIPDENTNTNANKNDFWTGMNRWLVIIPIAAAIVIFMMIMVIFSIIRKRKQKLLLAAAAEEQEENEEDIDEDAIGFGNKNVDMKPLKYNLADINNLMETEEQALKKEIQNFATQNPEIAAQLIRTWLKGEGVE